MIARSCASIFVLACVCDARRLQAALGDPHLGNTFQKKDALATFLFTVFPGRTSRINDAYPRLARNHLVSRPLMSEEAASITKDKDIETSESTQAALDTLSDSEEVSTRDNSIAPLSVGQDVDTEFFDSLKTMWSDLVQKASDDEAVEETIADEASDSDQETAMKRVIAALETDIPSLLSEEPQWEIFADNFQIIDQNGARTKGFGHSKFVLNMLRYMCRKFDVEVENVELDFSSEDFAPLRNFFSAQWKIHLRGGGAIGALRKPIEIELETLFHVSSSAKVDYIKIKRCLADGELVKSWPEVSIPASEAEEILNKKQRIMQISRQLDIFKDAVSDVNDKLSESEEESTHIANAAQRGVDSLTAARQSLETFRSQFGDTSFVQDSSLEALLKELSTTATSFNDTLGQIGDHDRGIHAKYAGFLKTAESDIIAKTKEKEQEENDLKKAEFFEQAKMDMMGSRENLNEVDSWALMLRKQKAEAEKKAEEAATLKARKEKERKQRAAEEAEARAVRRKEEEKAREERRAEQQRKRELAAAKAEAESLAAEAETEAAKAREEEERLAAEKQQEKERKRKEEARKVSERAEDIQRVISDLKVKIPKLLRRRPALKYLADDFKVIFKKGTTLNVDDTTRLLNMLRWTRNKFKGRDSIEVDFEDTEVFTRKVLPRRTFKATWKLRFGSAGLFRLGGKMLELTAVTVFHLNDQNKLDYVRIEQLFANGEELTSFPDVELVDNPKVESEERAKTISVWMEAVREKAERERMKREIALFEAAEAKKEAQKKAEQRQKQKERDQSARKLARQKAKAEAEAVAEATKKAKAAAAAEAEAKSILKAAKSVKAEAEAKIKDEDIKEEKEIQTEIQLNEDQQSEEKDGKVTIAKTSRKENVTAVLETLQKEIPLLLSKEPTWDYFSEDFQAMDEIGSTLNDLKAGKLLSEFVRSVVKKLRVKSQIEVNDIRLSDFKRPLFPQRTFSAQWKIQISSGSFFSFSKNPTTIEAKTVFHLDEKNRVDYVKISRCTANGRPLDAWPEVTLSEKASDEDVSKIEGWLQNMTAVPA